MRRQLEEHRYWLMIHEVCHRVVPPLAFTVRTNLGFVPRLSRESAAGLRVLDLRVARRSAAWPSSCASPLAQMFLKGADGIFPEFQACYCVNLLSVSTKVC